MAVRPIDGNELVDTLNQIVSDYTSHGMYPSAFPVEYAIEIVEKMPTLTPQNEPRMINADKLAKRIAGHSNYRGDSILAAIYCAAEGKESDTTIRPIETPPNEPLMPCDACMYNPPSSMGGKPCCICPAGPPERQEDT